MTWLSRRDALRLWIAGGGGLALAGLGAYGACRPAPALVIGTKDFSEQWILGELLADVAAAATGERAGRVDLAGTMLCHEALLSGDLHAYVEYTGTAYAAVLGRDDVPAPADCYAYVAAEYARRFDLRWLPPLGFENTWAVLVRRADAERHGLAAISDLARVQDAFRGAWSFEFYDRPDGYRGLVDRYGLAFGPTPQQMELGNAYRALAAGRVDVIIGNSTDGLIEHFGLAWLADDRRFFPPYDAAVVVRPDVAPAVVAAFEALAGRISTAAMRAANLQVDNRKRHPAPVARELLASITSAA